MSTDPIPHAASAERRGLRELFERLADLDAAARAAALREAALSAGERARVLDMLALDAAGENPFFRVPAADWAKQLDVAPPDAAALVGKEAGPFHIVELLGQGGSAIVYRAERVIADGVQVVALKLLHRGIHAPEAQRRFRNEQSILTQLSHPNVAHLIDAGISEAGTPYIAMEYVDGANLLEHAEAGALDRDSRLRLMVQLCRSVDAAHRALIVHRDLKPSNVLVARDGQVKVLDFGIAKLLLDDEPVTRTQHISLTPGYAAPEQYRPGPVTIAADVYALGVILGELLVGVRFGPNLQWPAPDSGTAQARRRWDALDRDLRLILRAAVAEDPQLRYPSAARLADDIEHVLANEPIALAGMSRWYRWRKFAARHRTTLAGAFAFVVAILIALGVAIEQASVARTQSRLARDEAQRAGATSDFLVDLLETASANLPKEQRPTPQQLVDQAAKRARADRSLAEPVRAQILATLGKVALSEADYAQAEALLVEALERERAAGVARSTKQWVYTAIEYADLLRRTSRSVEAEKLLTDLLPVLREQDSDAAVSGLMLLAAAHTDQGDADGALALGELGVQKAERTFGSDANDTIQTLTFFGEMCGTLRQPRRAETLLDSAVERWRRLGVPKDEHYARVLMHLGVVKEQLGRTAQADPLFVESIALQRQIYDRPHDRLATHLGVRGRYLARLERFDEADAALAEALDIDRQAVGENNVYTAAIYDARAQLEHARHDESAAETAARAALQRYDELNATAGQSRERALARLRLVEILLAQTRDAEAENEFAHAAPTLARDLRATGLDAAYGKAVEASVRQRRGDPRTALRLADEALALVAQTTLPATDIVVLAHRTRALALLALERFEAASTDADAVLAALRAGRPTAAAQHVAALALAARVAAARGDNAAVEAFAVQARALQVPNALVDPADAAVLRLSER